MPDESVIDDTVSRTRLWRNIGRRLFNLAIGVSAFVALIGVRRRSRSSGSAFAAGCSRRAAALMVIYAIDLVILIFIGRVPLAYNFRNLARPLADHGAHCGRLHGRRRHADRAARVRERHVSTHVRIAASRAMCWSWPTARPTRSFPTSAITTWPCSSARRRRWTIRRPTAARADPREAHRPRSASPIPMASREVYCIVNRPVENDPTRRQFVQVRGVIDPHMAGEVHGLPLVAGDWFSEAGVRTPAGAATGDRQGSDRGRARGRRGPGTRQQARRADARRRRHVRTRATANGSWSAS